MIFSIPKTKIAAAAVAAVLAGSAFGYWGYGEFREHELRNAVTEIVTDTSLRMRDALRAETGSIPANNPATLRRFYDHAVAVDGHLSELRGMDVSPIGGLGDAADDYVLTGREILLRRAASQRYRLKLAESIQALRNHMRADDRSGSWVREAVRAKERVEEDYRDYRITINALGTLLESFPASRAKMAPHVDAALLADDALVAEARKLVLESSKQVADEVGKISELAAYR